jgi:hypothetical protein
VNSRCGVETVLDEFPDQLVALAPHINDGTWTIPFCTERGNFYGFTGTPSLAIDGGNWTIEGTTGSCSSDANAYRTAINNRLQQTGSESPVKVSVSMVYNATTVTVTGTFELLDAASLVSPKGYVVLAEDGCVYNDMTFNHTVRAGYGELVSLVNPGDVDVVQRTFSRGTWNMNNVVAYAFLQRSSGTVAQREVYQAMSTAVVIDFHFAADCKIASVPAGNGTAELSGMLANVSDVTDELTVSLDDGFGWPAEFRLAGEAVFHTAPSVIALGPGGEIAVEVRVATDAQVRKGTGSIVVTSANTGRTKSSAFSVYNGSPSVLLVGDDNYRPDEVIVINGLTNAGYLFDHWDCFLDHGNKGPTFAQMKCYDVVVWHHGYELSNLLASEDMEAIMDYMDTGKGFILSSQDILSQTNPALPAIFKSNYLGVQSFTTNVDADHATATAADPITDGMDFDLTYLYSSWDRADNVVPNALASTIFLSEDQEKIAIRCDNGTARSVFFAFCINGMNESAPYPNDPATLLDRAIRWVKPAGPSAIADETRPMVASNIRSITPNPFSPAGDGLGSTAAIRLRVSEHAADRMARLDVVDISGRVVRNLVNRALPLGVSDADWDGRDTAGDPVSAGVYYLRFETADGTHSARTVVIR